jgi:diketogulonate reductase-like aldo/keto reductase
MMWREHLLIGLRAPKLPRPPPTAARPEAHRPKASPPPPRPGPRQMLLPLLSLLLLGSSAAHGATAPTAGVEIAPGVHMPFISDGIILDASGGEVKGLDLFFQLGGRGVDTAWSYRNQPNVGKAVRQASVNRSEVFLTTKIECMGTADAAYGAIERDLRQLGLKQIDLVLIHAPYKGYGEPYSNCSKGPAGAAARRATWKGMERAVRAGLTRAIGLSNFDVEYMTEIMAGAEIPPAVNQCCLCVGYRQVLEIAYAKKHGITYEAYSPLGGKDIGGTSVLDYPQLKAIAKAVSPLSPPGPATAAVCVGRQLCSTGACCAD